MVTLQGGLSKTWTNSPDFKLHPKFRSFSVRMASNSDIFIKSQIPATYLIFFETLCGVAFAQQLHREVHWDQIVMENVLKKIKFTVTVCAASR